MVDQQHLYPQPDRAESGYNPDQNPDAPPNDQVVVVTTTEGDDEPVLDDFHKKLEIWAPVFTAIIAILFVIMGFSQFFALKDLGCAGFMGFYFAIYQM